MATLFCNGSPFPRFGSRTKADKSILDDYYSYNMYTYGNIALPKWIWRLVRLNDTAGKLFDFATYFSHTDNNGNISTRSHITQSKANRWDINTSFTGYGGTLYFDDVQRAKSYIGSMGLNATGWAYPIEGTRTINNVTQDYDNSNFILRGTQPNYPGFTQIIIHQCSIYHPESSFMGVYDYATNSEGVSVPDTFRGTVFSDLVHLDIEVTHATDGNYNQGQNKYTSTLYKTRKLIRIGGFAINQGYINSDDYARGWRTTNSTDQGLTEFNIGGGISFYKKVLKRNYTSSSQEVTQWGGFQGPPDDNGSGAFWLDRTFGGDIEGGAGHMTKCKMEPLTTDFDTHFVSTW